MQNVDQERLLEILLNKYKAIVVDIKDPDRPFLDTMCQYGYLVNYDNIEDKKYYHVKEKLKNEILTKLKVRNGIG